jgi:heme/copper-type cytochrome/quinol oxidase subunit 3
LRVFSPFGVPLFNTLVLLTSGATVTLVHWLFVMRKEDWTVMSYTRDDYLLGNFNSTLALGLLFLFMQFREYLGASFSISDGVYGSVFYLLTGLHGFHVLVGLVFLFVCYVRVFFCHFTQSHHLGFEFAV